MADLPELAVRLWPQSCNVSLLITHLETRDGVRILTPAIVSHVIILAIIASSVRVTLTFMGFVLPIVTAVVIAFTLKRTAFNK